MLSFLYCNPTNGTAAEPVIGNTRFNSGGSSSSKFDPLAEEALDVFPTSSYTSGRERCFCGVPQASDVCPQEEKAAMVRVRTRPAMKDQWEEEPAVLPAPSLIPAGGACHGIDASIEPRLDGTFMTFTCPVCSKRLSSGEALVIHHWAVHRKQADDSMSFEAGSEVSALGYSTSSTHATSVQVRSPAPMDDESQYVRTRTVRISSEGEESDFRGDSEASGYVLSGRGASSLIEARSIVQDSHFGLADAQIEELRERYNDARRHRTLSSSENEELFWSDSEFGVSERQIEGLVSRFRASTSHDEAVARSDSDCNFPLLQMQPPMPL